MALTIFLVNYGVRFAILTRSCHCHSLSVIGLPHRPHMPHQEAPGARRSDPQQPLEMASVVHRFSGVTIAQFNCVVGGCRGPSLFSSSNTKLQVICNIHINFIPPWYVWCFLSWGGAIPFLFPWTIAGSLEARCSCGLMPSC